MTVFHTEIGFWVGLAVLGGLTLAYILVCWLLPPRRKTETERG